MKIQIMGIPSAKKWFTKKLYQFVLAEGTCVIPEQATARKKVCYSCPKFGIVQPIPGLKVEGCTICQCPSGTKPHMKTIKRIKGEEPISIAEMLQIKSTLNPEDLIDETIICPHPDGNKWAAVDAIFLPQ